MNAVDNRQHRDREREGPISKIIKEAPNLKIELQNFSNFKLNNSIKMSNNLISSYYNFHLKYLLCALPHRNIKRKLFFCIKNST